MIKRLNKNMMKRISAIAFGGKMWVVLHEVNHTYNWQNRGGGEGACFWFLKSLDVSY